MPKPRSIYLIGSYPSSPSITDKQAMKAMMQAAGSYLYSLPSGETRRPSWIVEDLKLLEKHPDIHVAKAADYSAYDRTPLMTIKEGHSLDDQAIELTYHKYARQNWPIFDALRRTHGRPDLRMQINLPGTLQAPMFSFGTVNPLLGFVHRAPFVKAYQREAEAIWQDTTIFGEPGPEKAGQLLWQIELPAEVGGLDRAPAFLRSAAAAFFARGVVQQVGGLPEDAHVVLHLCNGDLRHQGFSHPKNAKLAVTLANAVIKRWPTGRVLEGVHLALAAGDQLPSTNAAFYEPLKKLKLPLGTRLIAGFIHEDASIKDQEKVLRIIEQTVGHQVDIASPCGFGRCTRQETEKLLRRSVELANYQD